MREVAAAYGVSLDAITYILRKIDEPRRSPAESSKIIFGNKSPSFSIREPRTPYDERLHIMGTMLYWAEGYKTAKAKGVDFANSNPTMILAFITFLRTRYDLDESRFRISLYCHGNQDIKRIIAFWSSLLRVSKAQFTKPYVRAEARDGHRTMQHGLVHVRYSDKKMLIDMLNLIDSYSREFRVGTQAVNEDTL